MKNLTAAPFDVGLCIHPLSRVSHYGAKKCEPLRQRISTATAARSTNHKHMCCPDVRPRLPTVPQPVPARTSWPKLTMTAFPKTLFSLRASATRHGWPKFPSTESSNWSKGARLVPRSANWIQLICVESSTRRIPAAHLAADKYRSLPDRSGVMTLQQSNRRLHFFLLKPPKNSSLRRPFSSW